MPWGIVYYETPKGSVPVRDFWEDCPPSVVLEFMAILESVRESPPPRFAGAFKWKPMKDDMSGYFEARVRHSQTLYRVFCVLENGTPEELARRGFDRPQIAVIDGRAKPNRTAIPEREYKKIRKLGAAYLASFPRSIAK